MELTDSRTAWLVETATPLQGDERRRLLARTVQERGPGGQRRAERALGWNRQTIRNAIRALTSGRRWLDAVVFRRRKRVEARLPRRLAASKALVDGQRQPAPSVRSPRLDPRLTAAEVRRRLIAQQGYTDAELPTERTSSTKLRDLGSPPTNGAKPHPQKRSLRLRPASSS